MKRTHTTLSAGSHRNRRAGDCPPGGRPRLSERAQEGQELFLLLLPQLGEPASRIGRLAPVAENGLPQGQRLPVVHVPTASPPPPKRRGPNPASGDVELRLHCHE